MDFRTDAGAERAFNLNRLGVVIREYAVNFYGTDYSLNPAEKGNDVSGWTAIVCLQAGSCARRELRHFAQRMEYDPGAAERAIEIPADFSGASLSLIHGREARSLRVREEFVKALGDGYVCGAFDRNPEAPRYLFYSE
jgi:predicted GNAT superfamily acetyltransferase